MTTFKRGDLVQVKDTIRLLTYERERLHKHGWLWVIISDDTGRYLNTHHTVTAKSIATGVVREWWEEDLKKAKTQRRKTKKPT